LSKKTNIYNEQTFEVEWSGYRELNRKSYSFSVYKLLSIEAQRSSKSFNLPKFFGIVKQEKKTPFFSHFLFSTHNLLTQARSNILLANDISFWLFFGTFRILKNIQNEKSLIKILLLGVLIRSFSFFKGNFFSYDGCSPKKTEKKSSH